MEKKCDPSPPMRILFINFKKFWGGGEKMSLALARGVRARGHDVRFLVRSDAPLGERLESEGIPAVGVNYRNPLLLAAAFWKHGPYDIMVTQSDQEIRYAYYLALFSGTPIAVRLGVSARPGAGPWQRFLHRRTVRINFANFKDGLEILADAYGAALRHPVLLPNGVLPPPALSADPRRALGIPQDAVVVGMVGRLEERKGCRLLLSAFQNLSRRCPELHLLMVGEGGLRAELERQTGDRIHVMGFMEAVGDVLRTLDILALPVLWGEGTSNAVLEAMSLGRPVVVSDDGGMRDVVVDGQTGLVVEKGSQSALEKALKRLIEDADLRRRLGRSGQKWVGQHHSMQAMVDTFLYWTQKATTCRGLPNDANRTEDIRNRYHEK
ncbi:MAG: glycosyltransferase family 4 protein [Desulfosarcinaceae bacterium]